MKKPYWYWLYTLYSYVNILSNHKNYLDKHFQSLVYSILLFQHQFTQEILFTELDAYSFTLFCVKTDDTDLWNTMFIFGRSIIFVWQKFMDNKMILQFILSYSLDTIDLANALISSPSLKINIFAMFSSSSILRAKAKRINWLKNFQKISNFLRVFLIRN